MALIIFYKIITDNDALLKFRFHLVVFNSSWKPGHSGAGYSRPTSEQPAPAMGKQILFSGFLISNNIQSKL